MTEDPAVGVTEGTVDAVRAALRESTGSDADPRYRSMAAKRASRCRLMCGSRFRLMSGCRLMCGIDPGSPRTVRSTGTAALTPS